jgi:hypothetical protein
LKTFLTHCNAKLTGGKFDT